MQFEASFDDGFDLDLQIAALLKKYKLPGTFYVILDKVDTDGYLSWPELKDLDKAGFVIGSHTMSHPPDLKRLYDDQLVYELETSKGLLESHLGHEVTKFCYPRGRYDMRVIDAVISAGYTEARTTLVGWTKVIDKLRKHTSVHVFDTRHEYLGAGWYSYAIDMFNRARVEDGVFHLWGHSTEIMKHGQLRALEEFFKIC